ncbi:MAG: hypothetical protein P4L59_16485 [Desulfosporosinus sp.]|nr:hypothetical protein [Desulfosporosinus sp.]
MVDFQNAVSIIVAAIAERKKVNLHFYSKEDQSIQQRTCAPLDVGPSRRAKIQNDRFHFWDYDSDQKPHVLSINPEQMVKIEALEEIFQPETIVNWDTRKSPWFVKRDWGSVS